MQVAVGAVALDGVGVGIDRENVVAAPAQAFVDDVAAVVAGRSRRRR